MLQVDPNSRQRSLRSTLCALLALACLAGCERWRIASDFPLASFDSAVNSDSAAKRDDAKSAASTTPLVQSYDWFEALGADPASENDSDYRFRNEELETLAKDSGAPALRKLIDQGGDAAASATIMLARLEPGVRDVDLERIAGSSAQKTATRLAAIETLARSPDAEATARLTRITTTFHKSLSPGLPLVGKPADEDRLLAAAIDGLHRQKGDVSPFTSLLAVDAPPLSCAALMSALQSVETPLTPSAVECFQHPSPYVRIALLQWAAEMQDEKAVDETLKITRGGDANILFAAISALGKLPGAKAAQRLEELARDRSPRIRGAALAALTRQNSAKAIAAALADSQWQVKRSYAEFLCEPEHPQQWEAVKTLLVDPAPALQQTLLRTIAGWSPEARTIAAAAGLHSPLPWARQAHWKSLQSLKPDLPPFEPLADDATRNEQLNQIAAALELPADLTAVDETPKAESLEPDALREWIAKFKSEEAQQRTLAELKFVSLGVELTASLDRLSPEELRALPSSFWTKVAVLADPRLAPAVRLKSPDAAERREGARELASTFAAIETPLCLLVWLDALLQPEEDPLVWRRALSVADHPRGAAAQAAAARLAASALRMETLDIRVKACEILRLAPRGSEYIAAIEPLLDAENQPERIAAIQALEQQRPLPEKTLRKLATMLDETHDAVHIEAALLLALEGDPRGSDTLVAAAQKGTQSQRRLAIERLGQTSDAAHVPLLISLLDASPTLRQAALGALENLTGESIASESERPFLSATETAGRWKAWYAEQAGRSSTP